MILHGDCFEQMKLLPPNSVDAIVTDPPYGLKFMNKGWDYEVPKKEMWIEALRVLKPGGHLLSFGGTRTYHRLVVAIEDAGFEIRDQIQWLYGSGFPKSLNVGKAIDKASGIELEVIGKGRSGSSSRAYQSEDKTTAGEYEETISNNKWNGWGTALKPANEPICLARKPLSESTVAKNVERWGCGAINIDASRIEADWSKDPNVRENYENHLHKKGVYGGNCLLDSKTQYAETPRYQQGRWPANIILDEAAAEMLDEQSGVTTDGGSINSPKSSNRFKNTHTQSGSQPEFTGYGSKGGASRFFFIAKHDKDSEWQNQKDLELVRFAANSSKCEEAHLNSVLEAVRTNFKKDHHLLQCLDSIPDYKKCILMQSLASLVEKPESIGITEITQSLLKLFGSVHHAIDENTNSESQKNNKGQTRFLYQAKASKRERNAGLEGMPLVAGQDMMSGCPESVGNTDKSVRKHSAPMNQNHHPTVKPIKLMEYLIRLITPPNGTVLDPFMGSGSTGVAAKNLKFKFIGIEMNEEYVEIAKKRISWQDAQLKT